MKITHKKGAYRIKIVGHNKPLLIVIFLLIVLLIGIVIYLRNVEVINDFESCIAAGNPAMESYPRQCRDPIQDKTFVEVIEDAWRLDSIQLMQHESEGFYACFGCSNPGGEGPALCIDPIQEMKLLEETFERHCSSEFEVLTYCSEESREGDACVEIYQPVCGWNDSEKIQCIKYPCASEYSNSCNACHDENVEYYTYGGCPE